MREYKLKKLKRVHSVHFAADGRRLLALGGNEARLVDAAVWLDLATGENVGRIERGATCVAIDPGLTRLAVGGEDGGAKLIPAVEWAGLDGPAEWRRFAWPKRGVPPTYRNVCGLSFDPSGSRLAVGHGRPVGRHRGSPIAWKLSVVDRDTGEAWAEWPTVFAACVMSFSPDGGRVAVTGGLDGDPRVTVFDVPAREAVWTFAPPATATRAVAFLPDGRLAAANGRQVFVLGPDGRPRFALDGGPKQVNAVAAAPGGSRLLTAGHDGAVRAWDAATGAPAGAFDWGIGAVTAVAFAPDGLTCAAAGLNGKVVVWDADG